MPQEPFPTDAAWHHRGARDGCEVVFFGRSGDSVVIEGSTVAVEAGEPWVVDYRLMLDQRWRTRQAEVTSRSRAGVRTVRLDHDGSGHWLRDGVADDRFHGCLDVDLEASALTNTLPVHRFSLEEPSVDAVSAPAVFVRAETAEVERLEQTYRRLSDGPAGPRFAYVAPIFDVDVVLGYDRSGLVLDYPGLAVRLQS